MNALLLIFSPSLSLHHGRTQLGTTPPPPANPCGLVESLLVFLFRIGVGDDAGADLIEDCVFLSNESADGDVEGVFPL